MYSEKTVNGYLVGESEVLAVNGTNDVNGPAISSDIGGNKILVGANFSVAGGASAATLNIQYSHDGVNWTAKEQLIADLVATGIGVKLALVDLTSKRAPFYRLVLGGVTSLGTAGRFSLIYAVPGKTQA